MQFAQPVDALLADIESGFAQQHVGKEPAAHADLAVDAPHREVDALFIERVAPGQDVLVHTVHKRTVEIEQERCLQARHEAPLL